MSFYTRPAIGKNFFAREDLLSTLLKSAKDIAQGYRHNISIVGRGLIGKSSLLLHFLNTIKEDKNLIPVYIDLKDCTFAEFVEKYISTILYYSLRRCQGLNKTADLRYLIDCTRTSLPETYDLVKKIKMKDLREEAKKRNIPTHCVKKIDLAKQLPKDVLEELASKS